MTGDRASPPVSHRSAAMRVVSLLPAGTEIVAALGQVDRLVGVTHECDHPASVRSLPQVTASGVDAAGAPGEVDAAVRALAAAGQALFTLDERWIAQLAPDVILTQRLCDVCAVREHDVRALAGRLASPPRVVTLQGTSIDGVLDDVLAVAQALGVAERGVALRDGILRRLQRVHGTLKATRAMRPRVAVIEWGDPVFVAGHWVPEMVRHAGGVDALAQPGEHSRPRDVGEVAAADPEVVLIAPCGYDVARAEAEAHRVLASAPWAWARKRCVWAVDANAFVSRPGPRLADGVEVFAAIFSPGLFPPPSPSHARPVVCFKGSESLKNGTVSHWRTAR